MKLGEIILRDKSPIWIIYLHPNFLELSKKAVGKWVHHDLPERLSQQARDLLPLIVEELTPEIKFRPVLNDPRMPFAHLLPPLCVYSSPENKKILYERLVDYGLKDIYWQDEEETLQRAHAH